jgi:hypothetical protein
MFTIGSQTINTETVHNIVWDIPPVVVVPGEKPSGEVVVAGVKLYYSGHSVTLNADDAQILYDNLKHEVYEAKKAPKPHSHAHKAKE